MLMELSFNTSYNLETITSISPPLQSFNYLAFSLRRVTLSLKLETKGRESFFDVHQKFEEKVSVERVLETLVYILVTA